MATDGRIQLLEITAKIEQSASQIERLVAQKGPAAYRPEPNFEALRQACRDLEDHVLELSASMEGRDGIQDYELRRLFEFLTHLRRTVEDAEARGKPDAVAFAIMKLHDTLRRLERSILHTRWESPEEAVRYIFEVLDGVSTTELARLLGVSDKTINSWRQGVTPGKRADRVVLTAQLLSYLRTSLTTRGLVMWFDTSFDALGSSPRELIDENVKEAEAPVVSFARGGRGQLGA